MSKVVLKQVCRFGLIALCVAGFASNSYAQEAASQKEAAKPAQAAAAPAAPAAKKPATVEEKFRTESKLVEGLQVYNDQLKLQIEAQKTAMSDLRKSIRDAGSLERKVVPLMKKMLDSLDGFVRADLPFNIDARRESIGQLRAAMVDSGITLSERFRQVLSVYEIEGQYGRTYEAYSGPLQLDGNTLDVDYLRVGRLGFYFQTKDGKTSGMWNKNTGAWEVLDSGYNRHVRRGIKMASKSIAPEMMNLPIYAPEDV